jgi:hypothetical protein
MGPVLLPEHLSPCKLYALPTELQQSRGRLQAGHASRPRCAPAQRGERVAPSESVAEVFLIVIWEENGRRWWSIASVGSVHVAATGVGGGGEVMGMEVASGRPRRVHPACTCCRLRSAQKPRSCAGEISLL